MRVPRRMSRLAMSAAAMLVLPAVVSAQHQEQQQQQPASQQPLSGYEKSINVSTTETATVKAIDPAARRLTLETSDGETRTIKCGKDMANFDQIKVGDQVKAMAMEQVAVSISKDKSADNADDGVITRAPKGSKPGMFIGRSEETTAKIDAVDPEKHTVTLSIAGGPGRAVKVSPDVPLTTVKPGDEVNVRLTKGIVLWVQSPTTTAQPAGAQPAAASVKPDDAAGGAGEDEAAIDTASVKATVEAIDSANRIVTLKGSGGKTKQIKVGKEAINFDQLKVGDTVRATVAEEVIVAVGKGELPSGAPEGTVAARMPKGGKPGIIIAESDNISGKVQSVDADKHTITLVEAGGEPRTIKAAPKVKLSELKAGDEVNARVTQALAILVEKP